MAGAAFNRGKSRQDYATPPEFIAAVERRFGPISFDLAAEAHNAKAPQYFCLRDNALVQPWHPIGGLLWLNPPFKDITPWAAKCREEAAQGARIAFLVPAAVGSNWFRDYVHERARVYFLNGRISFDGKNGYPKDCLLALFSERPGFEIWSWRKRS